LERIGKNTSFANNSKCSKGLDPPTSVTIHYNIEEEIREGEQFRN
jgi:hypothetical protein